MSCVPSNNSSTDTCSDYGSKDACNNAEGCTWLDQTTVTLVVVLSLVFLLIYVLLLVFLSRWIARRLKIDTAVIVLVGIFFPPAWIVFLVMAMVQKEGALPSLEAQR